MTPPPAVATAMTTLLMKKRANGAITQPSTKLCHISRSGIHTGGMASASANVLNEVETIQMNGRIMKIEPLMSMI